MKTLNGVTTFATDHTTNGIYTDTIMKMTGHATNTSRSVEITGSLTASQLELADNNKLSMGTGNAMSIYHSGSDGYISNTTGALKVGTDSAVVTIGNSTSEVTVGDNLTVSGNTTVVGDLTVNGAMTATRTTSQTIADKVIKLGEGNTAASHDLGIVFTRGDGTNTNIANRALIWKPWR